MYDIERKEDIDRGEYKDSRYRNLQIAVDVKGNRFFTTRSLINFKSSPKDRVHEVKPGEQNRLDLIAYKYYNNPTLWWVITYANNILDPMLDVEVGDSLVIPAKSTLYGRGGFLA